MFWRSLFVFLHFFIFAVVLSVLLSYTNSDYPYGIIKLYSYTHSFSTSRSYWTVATGIHDRGRIYRSQIHHVRNVIVHEHYSKRRNHNDIALVKLDKPLDLTDSTTRAACLPEKNEDFRNLVCTVTGWGALHSGKH